MDAVVALNNTNRQMAQLGEDRTRSAAYLLVAMLHHDTPLHITDGAVAMLVSVVTDTSMAEFNGQLVEVRGGHLTRSMPKQPASHASHAERRLA